MALSSEGKSGPRRTADVLVFDAQRISTRGLFTQTARAEYLEGHCKRMERIRSLARAALEREEREASSSN